VDGQKILIGEKTIGQELLLKTPQALTFIEQMQKEGKTVLPVASDGKIIGILSIADVLRKEVRSTIAELKKTGLTRIVMLTGDHQAVANSIGQAAGMTDIFASQLPEDKVNSITNLADQGHSVGMVGDGVNDAPALATASVGIVMGAIGSDVAMEAADIALMSDDLSRLPFLIRLCRKTRSRIVFNIVVSMFINFGAIILAGFGLLNPVTAALVHNFGSVFVVINSALLLTYKEQDQYPLVAPALVTNGSHVN
jgi:P-type E1-E2 ATPase